MVMDIHSHTYYSNCGADDPRVIIENAISGGIELFGITDHNHGIGGRKKEYFDLLTSLRDEYADRIRILRGIEIATLVPFDLARNEDVSMFDYCLVEHIDRPGTTVGMKIFDYAHHLGCRVGIAHTDLIGMAEANDISPLLFLRRFAAAGIFWEMNVNYDSVHSWQEHDYVLRFCNSPREQELVRKSGIKISVGFDGHRSEDYSPERVKKMCRFLESRDIPLVQF
ncbi:MAG: PHP domain-containing protein [Ruminococcaceae bacterium]|nr:PHP domain-containing protein [Oscillospiraceae bacterium]